MQDVHSAKPRNPAHKATGRKERIVLNKPELEILFELGQISGEGVEQCLPRDGIEHDTRSFVISSTVSQRVSRASVCWRSFVQSSRVGAPVEVGNALTRLFRAPRTFPTVDVLARAGGRRQGMLNRWLRRAGIAPAKVLIVVARVAWAHHYMQAGNRLKSLALQLGYPDTIPFRRHIRWITGRRASELREDIRENELVQLLTRRVLRDRP